jgi:glutamate-ammonia-ligase adenylyltransferase
MSDADVMFVFRSSDESAAEIADRVAGEFIANCQDLRLLFDLDLELRPEGKKGARIRSLESYESYYSRWAEEWEFQALLKARFVAGSKSLGRDFIKLIAAYRYPLKLDSAQIRNIRLIKARVESERLPKGADPARHLKLGRGGISDVEWLAQLEQLQHAATHKELQTQGTLSTLAALSSLNLLDEAAASSLDTAWRLASRLRTAIALVTGKPRDQLPTDRIQLAAISQLLQRESPAALENEYLGASRRARRIFEESFFGAVEE